MTAQLSRERREIIKQTANHIISREDTSEHSENLKAVAELALLALAGMDSETVALQNFRAAMEGIGHIRRTLDETFGGLHGTHCEPDVRVECKAICDAICDAYRRTSPRAPVAVPDPLIAELLVIAKNAAYEADECAHAEHNDDSESHAKAIAEWESRATMTKAGPVKAATVPDGWTFESCENEPCKNGAVVNVHGADIHLCADCSRDKKYSRMKLTALTKRISLPLQAAPEQEV